MDILLEDGEYAMVVEVKSLLNKNDVIEHQQRMKIVREYADKRNDKRKYIAAVAAANSDNEAREYALASGIYVIEQTSVLSFTDTEMKRTEHYDTDKSAA